MKGSSRFPKNKTLVELINERIMRAQGMEMREVKDLRGDFRLFLVGEHDMPVVVSPKMNYECNCPDGHIATVGCCKHMLRVMQEIEPDLYEQIKNTSDIPERAIKTSFVY